MQDYIEFEINGIPYSVAEIASGEFKGQFCWGNDTGEEGDAHETLLDAYQAALDHEGSRVARERGEHEASQEAECYAREQWHNRNGDVQ